MHQLTRRHLLQVGGLGLAGLAAPAWLRGEGKRTTHRPRPRAVIFLHQGGGPSQHDTFDMKPGAPAEVRGEFRPIATRVPGLQVCERLPRTAGVMDRFTLVRTLRHTMKNHNSAGYYSLTGYAPPTD